jgi:hypothetical protein
VALIARKRFAAIETYVRLLATAERFQGEPKSP